MGAGGACRGARGCPKRPPPPRLRRQPWLQQTTEPMVPFAEHTNGGHPIMSALPRPTVLPVTKTRLPRERGVPSAGPTPCPGGGSGGRRGASRGLVTPGTESLTHLLSACGDSHIEIHGAQTFWGPRGFITWGCELAQGHVDEWSVGRGVMTPRKEEAREAGAWRPSEGGRAWGGGAAGRPRGQLLVWRNSLWPL